MDVNWVKRIGQAHHSTDGKTLCGMPCLGSNYVDVIAEKHWKICTECEDKYNAQVKSNKEDWIKYKGETDGKDR